MGKKIKITEMQAQQMIDEGVDIMGQTDSTGKADISKTSQEIASTGIDPKKVNVKFPGTAMSGGSNGISENKIITKKELQENRLKYLKENSNILTLNEFMRKLH